MAIAADPLSAVIAPAVTVVIPVRNDAARLRQCLASMLANEQPDGGTEILVADNGSRDGSAEVGASVGATVLSLPDLSVAQLRNRAASAAKGQVLAFVDADHLVDRHWLVHGLETLARHHAAGVGAEYQCPAGGTWVQQAYDRFRAHRAGVHETEWLGSGNLIVLRDAFFRVGGFDDSLETCEDVDLCNRLRAAGLRLVSDSRLLSVHLGDPATLRALFFGELWRGRDNIRVSLRGPMTLRALPSAILPVANLLLVLLTLVGLVAIPWVGGWLAAAGSGGFMVSVLLRATRMTTRRPPKGPLDLMANLAVAAVYEAARAVALVLRVTHRTRRELTARGG